MHLDRVNFRVCGVFNMRFLACMIFVVAGLPAQRVYPVPPPSDDGTAFFVDFDSLGFTLFWPEPVPGGWADGKALELFTALDNIPVESPLSAAPSGESIGAMMAGEGTGVKGGFSRMNGGTYIDYSLLCIPPSSHAAIMVVLVHEGTHGTQKAPGGSSDPPSNPTPRQEAESDLVNAVVDFQHSVNEVEAYAEELAFHVAAAPSLTQAQMRERWPLVTNALLGHGHHNRSALRTHGVLGSLVSAVGSASPSEAGLANFNAQEVSDQINNLIGQLVTAESAYAQMRPVITLYRP